MSHTILHRGGHAAAKATSLIRQYSGATSSSSATVSAVDQMIEYAMGQQKAQPNMAVDVLMSGLSYCNPDTDPLGAARLHLVIAQIEADRCQWTKAHTHASTGMRLAAPAATATSTPVAAGGSAAPCSATAPELTLAAGSLATRALLILGEDGAAHSLASQCEQALRTGHPLPSSPATTSSSSHHTRSLGLLALAAHAASLEASTATAVRGRVSEQLAIALGLPLGAATASAALPSLTHDPYLADAAHAWGLICALEGGRGPAAERAEAAFAGAAAAVGPAGGAVVGATADAKWMRQLHNHEVEADALTGRAQLQMRAREWGAAEELLGAALKAAEAAHGERSPALAPLLTLLGYTYSRSARVTFAEGLYREAAKLLRLDPARLLQQVQGAQVQPQGEGQQGAQGAGQDEGPAQERVAGGQGHHVQLLRRTAADAGVHASAVAVLAWRFAQLLWVLPNRGGEAARWEACARQFWTSSGDVLAGNDMVSVLGGEGHLRGEGQEGSGVVISTRFRRAWACQPVL